MRILVVEDSTDMLGLYEIGLTRLGHSVVLASATPPEAVLPVDVAIVDYQLKDMTGADVVCSLRKVQPDLPVVFATAATANEVLESLDGVVLRKPFAFSELADALEAVTGRQP